MGSVKGKADATVVLDTGSTDNTKEIITDFFKKRNIKGELVEHEWKDFGYNEAKCKRDVGYILDAVKTDLVYGGNERSRQAGEYYYKYPSQATGAELAPTLTGIKYAKGLVLNVLTNTIFQTPSVSKQTAKQLLVDNKEWIQQRTIDSIDANLATIDYNRIKCKRDVGYIVDAVATDILYGGNERTIKAGSYYFLFPSQTSKKSSNHLE